MDIKKDHINFAVGPVQISEEISRIGADPVPYFRTPDFSALMKENEALLKEFMDAPEDARAVFLTGSGTASMDAVTQNVFTKDDRLLVVAGGSYFLGGFGRLYGDQVEMTAAGTPVYDSIMPTMLSTLPDLLIGIVIVLVLSASMSTLSSLVLTSSSTLTLDLLKDNVVKNMSEKKQLVYMRVLIVVFIVISAVIALVQYNSSITFIAQLMSISWGALAGSFLGPFFWGLYSRRVSRPAVWASFIVGVGLTTGNMIAGFVGTAFIASPINCGAIAMVLSLIIVPVVSLFTKRVEFEVDPPHVEGAIDREYEQELEAE